MNYRLENKKIWVAGHLGMVGSAIVRRLRNEDCEILTVGRDKLDLLDQKAVSNWFLDNLPDCVIIAAAKVGGIHANNSRPVDFLYNNLAIQNNILSSAHACNVERLLFLGSSCIYPKYSNQPISENSLLAGKLEPTNEWYAIAKIAGIKLVQAYRKQYKFDWISAMPTNLYGIGDNYDLKSSHVLPALLRKIHNAKLNKDKEVIVWGSGEPLREFLHCDDLADALIFILKHYSDDIHINVGSGKETSIKELVNLISNIVDYHPKIKFDASMPDGTPRKLLDSSKLNKLGWNNSRSLESGIEDTYADFLNLKF